MGGQITLLPDFLWALNLGTINLTFLLKAVIFAGLHLVGVSKSDNVLARFGKLSFESLGNSVMFVDEIHKV